MRQYDEQMQYVATVENQQIILGSKSGQPQLLLTVKLFGVAKKRDDFGPNKTIEGALAGGIEELPDSLKLTRSLYFDLDPNGPKLDRVMTELKTLGYSSTDMRRLHPQHARHVSFLGKKVVVRVWYTEDRNDATKERDKWFLVTPRNIDACDFAAFAGMCANNADAYVAASRGSAESTPPGTTSNDDNDEDNT